MLGQTGMDLKNFQSSKHDQQLLPALLPQYTNFSARDHDSWMGKQVQPFYTSVSSCRPHKKTTHLRHRPAQPVKPSPSCNSHILLKELWRINRLWMDRYSRYRKNDVFISEKLSNKIGIEKGTGREYLTSFLGRKSVRELF